MLAIRRLLFPTDYSPCADRAFAHAVFLAERHDAELRILHVGAATTGDAPHLHAYCAPPGVRLRLRTVRSSTVASTIVAAAAEVDLVVMGTHGRRGLTRATVGSTTETVLRTAGVPVLAVGLDADRPDPTAVARVLVPVDFSSAADGALAVGQELAALYGARVDVLHAVHLPDLPDIYGLGLHFDGTYPTVVERAGEALQSLARQAIAPERLGEVVVRIGPPGPTILDEAERLNAGLLVMPTHGRTGLDRVAMGSVAEQVLRRAPCAVLVLSPFGRTLPLVEGASSHAEPSAA